MESKNEGRFYSDENCFRLFSREIHLNNGHFYTFIHVFSCWKDNANLCIYFRIIDIIICIYRSIFFILQNLEQMFWNALLKYLHKHAMPDKTFMGNFSGLMLDKSKLYLNLASNKTYGELNYNYMHRIPTYNSYSKT